MKAAFERDGFVCPITVMPAEDAADYRRQLEEAEARHGADKTFRKILRRYPNLALPFVDEITRRPEITDVIAEILGPDLLVLDAPFFIKEADTKSFVSWHQDLHYWGLETEEEVTAWVALSPATKESGCMRFVAGSQDRQVDHSDTFAEDNLLTRGQEVDPSWPRLSCLPSEPDRRPTDRPRHPLHPGTRPSDRRRQHGRNAGPGRGSPWELPALPPAVRPDD